MTKPLKIMLLCLSLWMPTSIVRAHINSYATDQLQEMSQVMQLSSQLDNLSSNDTLYLKYHGKNIIVRTKNNRVNHIGYCIFTPEQRSAMQSPVFDFLERYVLALDLPLKRVKPINNQLAEDKISFSGGDISSMPHLYNDSTLNLSINLIEDKKYNVTWERDNIPYFSIEFPISYDLLHGTEMSENERRLAEDLKALAKTTSKQTSGDKTDIHRTPQKEAYNSEHYDLSDLKTIRKVEQSNIIEKYMSDNQHIISTLKSTTPPKNLRQDTAKEDTIIVLDQSQDDRLLIPNNVSPKIVTREQLIESFNDNQYILPGESFYLTNLNSNKYYKQDRINGGYSLIFTPHYPIESITNLFTTTEINSDHNVDVTLKQYGFKQSNLTIPTNDFVNYFIEQGCKPFFGIMEYTNKKIVGLLIMYNRAEGYCHTIRITADIDILIDETKAFKARIVSYIPISRVKSLYEEYDN